VKRVSEISCSVSAATARPSSTTPAHSAARRAATSIRRSSAAIAPLARIVDSFAGGGGASLGIQWALGRSPDIAINHDKEAIALHARIIRLDEHYPENVWKSIRSCVRRAPVGLMWLSPDCKHFSKAKGGKPVKKKIRGLAWVAVRWAKAVRPRVIILENVEEFQTLGAGLERPASHVRERKGQTFRAFVASSSGSATRRVARAPRVRLRRADDSEALLPHRALRRPADRLAQADARQGHAAAVAHRGGVHRLVDSLPVDLRAEEGARREHAAPHRARDSRYVIESPRPFIVQYHSARRPGDDRIADLAAPLPTQTVENRFGCRDTGARRRWWRAGQSPERSLEQPYQTITAKADARSSRRCSCRLDAREPATSGSRSLEEPARTITGAHRGEQALVAPTLIQTGYGEDKHRNAGAGSRRGRSTLRRRSARWSAGA
jgi:DNA (cytosine-5)-methyltransferase 1